MRTLPRLESERLVLSVAGRDDYIRLRDLVADPQVQRYLGPPPENPTADMFARALRAAGSWHLYGYGMFLIWEKAGGAFVGQAGVFHTLRGFGKGLDDVLVGNVKDAKATLTALKRRRSDKSGGLTQ